jgi:hypothetical protein
MTTSDDDGIECTAAVGNHSIRRTITCIAIIAVATVFMVASTWLTWPDPIYDFGAQLYFPWQIASGKHLYTDLAYFNGPLSEYFNAAMFKLFGASVHTLMFVNGAITLGVIAILFRLVSLLSDTVTATTACLVFVIVFGFSRYRGVGIGNYNWICPYTHEITHGVALSLAMVLAISAFLRTNHKRWLVTGSALTGLVFLTKAEVFVPAAGSCAIGLILRFRSVGIRRGIGEVLMAGLAFATVLMIAFFAIRLQTSSAVAFEALRGSWPWVLERRIGQLQFYQQGLGTDELSENLWRMLLIGMVSMAPFGTLLAVGVAPTRWRTRMIILFFAELVAVCCEWPWSMQIARPWPVFVAVIAGIASVQSWRAAGPGRIKPAVRAMFSMLALGLLGKMMFNARPWQYGFALAMPAAMVLIEAIVGWLPAWMTRRGYDGVRVRWAGTALVAVLTLCLFINQRSPSEQNIRVGIGSDAFMADHRGAEVNWACNNIRELIRPTDTLAVMPQGLMLNFLTRHPDSIAAVNIMPPEVISGPEDRIVEELNTHPPALIVISERDVANHAFILPEGNYHYGQKVYSWVMTHYRCQIPAVTDSELRLSIWLPKHK